MSQTQDLEKTSTEIFFKFAAIWLEKDLKPWLEGARTSVIGSGLLPKIPAFEGDALFQSDELRRLYDDWRTALNTLTDYMQKATGQKLDAGQLCKGIASMLAAERSMKKHEFFAKVVDAATSLSLSLQRFAEDYYADTFCTTLELAGGALLPSIEDTSKSMLFLPVDETTFLKSMEMCDKASFLTTGLTDGDHKAKLQLCVATVKTLLTAAFHYGQSPDDKTQAADAFI